jgi:hypothetical protein
MPATSTRARKPEDLKRRLKPCYTAGPEPVFLRIPALKYLMVDGQGDPGTSPEFQGAIQALFTLTYGAKFRLKKAGDRREFPVMALEGLFWRPGSEGCALTELPPSPEGLHWTLMIAQPAFVTASLIGAVRRELARKRPLPALSRVRLERLAEGQVAQILHVGPYDAEGPAITRLFAFIAAAGRTPRGRHHEIYLNDPRRVGPAKTRTIIRQPVT